MKLISLLLLLTAEAAAADLPHAVLLIRPPVPGPGINLPDGYFDTLLRDLERELTKRTRFSRVAWAVDLPTAEPAVMLKGELIRFDKGNRARRHFLGGMGAGRTRLDMQLELTDHLTGEVLLQKVVKGTVTSGVYGGRSSRVTRELAKAVAKEIERRWPK